MSVAVKATGLIQRFGRSLALGPLNLEVEAGERMAVLGPNGAGKTTLLRLLATASRPTDGSLEVLGFDVGQDRGAIRARMGYVPHQSGLYPWLTALENLEFFNDLHGLKRGARTSAALAEVGLSRKADSPVAELSKGMQQRLALARSLLHNPELWILDEPDASLDAEGRDLLGTLMEGRTVVMATHDQGLADSLCGRQIQLDQGMIAVGQERDHTPAVSG
ncbi:MAG TPA: heme ABC exporter ATP-binding protein CcmA [Candidatus Dormibacteraeota bacterium]|nr:heme ABC exporter ATP-binding protein CcmA [Candidatus Dormibacteraeota bacterium]